MPGDPHAFMAGSYQAGPARVDEPANNTHWGFIFWLVVIGVLIPAAIIGGLQVGGFSFVFRHR